MAEAAQVPARYGVTEALTEFLPGPVVAIIEKTPRMKLPTSGLCPTPAQYWTSQILQRSLWDDGPGLYLYFECMAPEGLRAVSEYAVLNANYLLSRIRNAYHLPYDRTCMHEFVVEGIGRMLPEVHALDIAKRLMDYKFHPPTNYFPLIVHEALMIEPTETESKQTLDSFADALNKIAVEAHQNPDLLKQAPHDAPIGRLDEVKAAKELVLCCWLPENYAA